MFSLLQLVLPCTMNWQLKKWSCERKDNKFTSMDSVLLMYGILAAHKSVLPIHCMCSMYKHMLTISRSSCMITLARSKTKPNKSEKGITALKSPFLTCVSSCLLEGITYFAFSGRWCYIAHLQWNIALSYPAQRQLKITPNKVVGKIKLKCVFFGCCKDVL